MFPESSPCSPECGESSPHWEGLLCSVDAPALATSTPAQARPTQPSAEELARFLCFPSLPASSPPAAEAAPLPSPVVSVLHNPPNWVLVPPVKAATESLSCRYHRTFINATSKEHRVHLNFLCIVGSIYTNIKLSLNTSCVALKNHETKKTCKFALHISKIPLIYLIYHLQMLLFICL